MSLFEEYWPIIRLAIAVILPLTFVHLAAFIYIYAERKVAGHIQCRLGPMHVGWHGILQSLADGIKLISKEDLVPLSADKKLFLISPYIVLIATVVAFAALPFAPGLVPLPLNIGIFFVTAVLGLEVFGVILAGYASNSKWALYGAMREAAQVVSYEVPVSICIVTVVLVGGTLDMQEMVLAQTRPTDSWLGGTWIWNWYMFHDPFLFITGIVFYVCIIASSKRAPFDLAEAESELVAGFHTEYSGMRWAFFFLAEYAAMFAVSGIFCILFLGGWHTGIGFVDHAIAALPPLLSAPLFAVVFIIKGSFLVLVMMWVRWTLPRIRIDQVMTTCLKYFLPISCFCLIGAATWKAFVGKGLADLVRSLFS